MAVGDGHGYAAMDVQGTNQRDGQIAAIGGLIVRLVETCGENAAMFECCDASCVVRRRIGGIDVQKQRVQCIVVTRHRTIRQLVPEFGAGVRIIGGQIRRQ